jgi:hypothetical protein
MANFFAAYLTCTVDGHNKHYYVAAHTDANGRPVVDVAWGPIGRNTQGQKTYYGKTRKGVTVEAFKDIAGAIRYAHGVVNGQITEDGYELKYTTEYPPGGAMLPIPGDVEKYGPQWWRLAQMDAWKEMRAAQPSVPPPPMNATGPARCSFKFGNGAQCRLSVDANGEHPNQPHEVLGVTSGKRKPQRTTAPVTPPPVVEEDEEAPSFKKKGQKTAFKEKAADTLSEVLKDEDYEEPPSAEEDKHVDFVRSPRFKPVKRS